MSQAEEQLETQPTQYTVAQKAREEGWKLSYDLHKHITTLSTGSILILVTFIERLFSNPSWKILVVIALSLFVVSIVLALLTMSYLMAFVRDVGEIEDSSKREHVNISAASFSCFLLGIICLVIFAVRNLIA